MFAYYENNIKQSFVLYKLLKEKYNNVILKFFDKTKKISMEKLT